MANADGGGKDRASVMSNNNYQITIEEVPGRQLLGTWMHLNAAEDKDECLGLWRAFARRIKAQNGLEGGEGYGLCANMRENLDCDYWTAIEARPGATIPSGMVPVTLDGGRYVCLTVDSGACLADCLAFIYNSWEKSQDAYKLDRSKPGFEQYGPDWEKRNAFRICVPCR